MRRFLTIGILCAVIVCFGHPIVVQAKPGVSADNAVLLEQSSGRVLFEKAAHEPRKIASITKVMTAIVAIESGKMDEMVTASHKAVYTEGSSIHLEEGEKMKLKDLVYGLMLRSGNDAAVAIAEHVGGSVEGFAYLMNEKADWLGMTNTHFDNPHGLDSEKHYSTAYDMALLMQYAMENDVFQEITGSTSHKAEKRMYQWRNKNKLLSQYDYCTGGKTGYTKTAGRTLVSSAEKEDMGLVVVTLNAPDDWNDHKKLFEWGYDNYDLTTLEEQGKKQYDTTSTRQTEGYYHHDLFFPLTENEKRKLQASTYLLKDLGKETSANKKIGRKTYRIDGEIVANASIYSDPYERKTFLAETWEILQDMAGVF